MSSKVQLGHNSQVLTLHLLTTTNQSHYIEVAQGDIFMEQKMWFGQTNV